MDFAADNDAGLKLVAFDLDGTIFKTESIVLDAVRLAVEELSGRFAIDVAVPSERTILSLLGTPNYAYVGKLGLSLTAQQEAYLGEAIERHELEWIDSGRGQLYPGTVECLEALDRRGLEIGIASNCTRPYLVAISDRFELDRWVDLSLCIDDFGHADKASILTELVSNRMILSHEAVYVGDRSSDLEAARRIGMRFIGCAWGYGAASELSEAETVAANFDELTRVVLQLAAQPEIYGMNKDERMD